MISSYRGVPGSAARRLTRAAPVESYPVTAGGMQPWAGIQWPNVDGPVPMSPERARALPSVGRVIGLISGLLKQMPLDAFQGETRLPRPRLLAQPDPEVALPWWIEQHATDYLLNGNAIGVVTSRSAATNWPLSVAWIPAEWVAITWAPDRRGIEYWVGGEELNPADVIHVRRGADRWCPYRGVGIVEQHFQQLGKVDAQDAYERGVLNNAAVPSVVITVPTADVTQTVVDQARAGWIEKYGGANREPAVLPAGTTVTPLAWSPNDAQMVEARRMSLTDVANLANLDGFWLGAPAGGSLTYKSPAPMYLNLIRQTIAPILLDFEGTWSGSLVPRGQTVRADRTVVLRDDMQTMVATAAQAVKERLWTVAEARGWLGMPADVPEELLAAPVAVPAAAPDQGAGQDPALDDPSSEGQAA